MRDYFRRLAIQVYIEDEGFSGKRPFGNSGWSAEIEDPVIEAGFATDDNVQAVIRAALEEL